MELKAHDGDVRVTGTMMWLLSEFHFTSFKLRVKWFRIMGQNHVTNETIFILPILRAKFKNKTQTALNW